MMGGFNRLIGVAVVALMCVGMWGCMGCSNEKVIDSGISINRHFYMVDDSTIMLDFFNWEKVEFYSSYIQGRDEEFRVTGYLAYLVNVSRDTVYKRIDFPKYEMKESIDQVDDDLILYYVQGKSGFPNIIEFAAWKFATDKALSYIDVNSEHIDSTDYLAEIHKGNFKNKKVFSLHKMNLPLEYKSRFFYVWDIAENSIARWEPTGESAWMAECNDIRWTEKQFRCLMADGDILLLDENKNVLDSLAKGSYQLDVSANYSLRFYGSYIGVGHQIYKMYENGKISDKPLFEIYFEEFTSGRTVLYPSSGDTVYYSEDNIN